MKHRVQITQQCSEYSLMTTPWSLCKIRLLRGQKGTITIANSMQSVYLSKVKASTPSLAQTQARRCLRHSLVASSTMLTVYCSPCYISVSLCFSLLTSRSLLWSLLHCFPNLGVIWFRSPVRRSGLRTVVREQLFAGQSRTIIRGTVNRN